jgi:glutamyl-tRNA reductase
MAGINHRTAPVALREKAAVGKGAGNALADLKTVLQLDEIVALSTCNRTEFYWAADRPISPRALFASLADLPAHDLDQLEPCIYCLRGIDAARHLFHVACGLDSLVVGETEILNQVKRAYDRSHELGLTAVTLNLLFQKAFEAAKKVHTQTQLIADRASIPSMALKLTEAIFDDLAAATIVVVGTGEMARVTVENLISRGAHQIQYVTRTEARAREWAAACPGAPVTTLAELPRVLPAADIVIACTMTEKPVITRDLVAQVLADRRSRWPLLLLDLGIPRNIEPEVGKLAQVYLHNIDDLQAIVAKNQGRVEAEAAKARAVIDNVVASYHSECKEAEAADTIRDLRSRLQQVADSELDAMMRKTPDLSQQEQEQVAALVHRIMGKILHHPAQSLREASRQGQGEEASRWAKILFGLDPDSRE